MSVCRAIDVWLHYLITRLVQSTLQPSVFVSWLGVDSEVAFDVDGGGERPAPPPIDGGGGKRGRGVPRRPPPPPFKAADMEGLRLETWLLEVSRLCTLGVVVVSMLWLVDDTAHHTYFRP